MCKNAIDLWLLLNFLGIITGRGQSLRDTTLQADYVIICASSNQPQAERLAQFRRSYNGFTTRVVPIESVYVSFPSSNSLDSSLRNFIAYTTTSWSSPKPRFFVLAGNINTIPSHKEPGLELPPTIDEDSVLVDHWYVETDGSLSSPLRSRASIGRLPAWTASQLDTIISKTIAYDQTLPGVWMRRSLMLADYNDNDGNIFELVAADLQKSLCKTWFDTTMVHVQTSSPQYQDVHGFLAEWRQGAAINSLVGHGNPWSFSKSKYLTASDVQALGNGARLPICFFLACAQAYYHADSASIVENLLLQSNGGAAATVASSGEIFLGQVSSFFQQLAISLSMNSSMSLGEAISLVQDSILSSPPGSLTSRLTLLGDPAIHPKRSLVTAGIVQAPVIATKFFLAQNYPNPFNPSTTISYSLPKTTNVSLRIFNALGQEVASLVNERKEAGNYQVQWNTSNAPTGIYFYRLQAGEYLETKKMVVLK